MHQICKTLRVIDLWEDKFLVCTYSTEYLELHSVWQVDSLAVLPLVFLTEDLILKVEKQQSGCETNSFK